MNSVKLRDRRRVAVLWGNAHAGLARSQYTFHENAVGQTWLVDLSWLAEALCDHVVEGGDAFRVAHGEATIDLHEGKEAGAAHLDGRDGEDASGILGHFPGACIAAAENFTEVAAPDANLEVVVEFRTFGELGEKRFEGYEGVGGEVEPLAEVLASQSDCGRSISLHHRIQVRVRCS